MRVSAVRARSSLHGPRQTESTSELELYKLARAQIEHENTLIGERITWYLTLQGFLLTAVFLTAANLVDPDNVDMDPTGRLYLSIAIGLLCVLGIGSSISCYLLIRVANSQIDEVSGWWESRSALAGKFPRITGKGGFRVLGYRVTGADFAHVILLIWLVLLVLLILAGTAGVGSVRPGQDVPNCNRKCGDGCATTVGP